MIYIEERKYQSVNADTSVNHDYVIPIGEILRLSEMGASSTTGTTTLVQIIWDPAGENQIILAEYGSTVQKTGLQFTGDGEKVLRIRLTNNGLVNSEIMGGYFIGMQG